MPTGVLLMEANKVSRYDGGGAIGAVTGTGDLYVYDDRLEFHKKSGDQRVLGFLVAVKSGCWTERRRRAVLRLLHLMLKFETDYAKLLKC